MRNFLPIAVHGYGLEEIACARLIMVLPLTSHPARFDGIFVALNPTTAMWSETTWRADIKAMQDVGMSFFVLPHLVRQTGPATATCALGKYDTYFPIDGSSLQAECFTPVGIEIAKHAGGTFGTVISAANATGMHIHLGLALQDGMDDPGRNVSVVKSFAWLQWEVAQQLWKLTTAAGLSHIVDGFYTEAEESNSHGWLEHMEDFSAHYFQPLAHDVHTLREDLLVWASPYAVANRTRYSTAEWVLPATFGGLWEQTFAWAPDLDLVALQDSTGALANSFSDVRELLSNVSLAAYRQHRPSWTNIELFEVWPRSCEWPAVCHGRHPAPFSRIKAQLLNEAPLLLGDASKIIAWEWSSCLSPTTSNGAAFPDANRANYDQYRQYVAQQETSVPREAGVQHGSASGAVSADATVASLVEVQPGIASLPKPNALLAQMTAWIMTLGVGNNHIANTSVSPYSSSIFINSNLARVLLASYKLTGNQDHLAEGLAWCDAFVAAQQIATTHDGSQQGGWWNTGYD